MDSYAWVEYFLGSSKSKILRKLFLNSKNSFITIDCCLAEINGWSLKNKKDFNRLFKIIIANSNILSLTEKDWINAGEERFKQRRLQKDFGLINSVILVKQKELNCKIISGDKHFKNINGVIFLE